ncbi:hypothetical protein [Rhodopirellula europaea]|uniref:hypothetical protein n=1 Tax=Rhodopirellula europaea TaxID=1263866 RepID=UPI003D292FA9|tara:strand:- start:5633 stop:6118 length:486 start_codon:yes stop_codon:yes gene_type:complete
MNSNERNTKPGISDSPPTSLQEIAKLRREHERPRRCTVERVQRMAEKEGDQFFYSLSPSKSSEDVANVSDVISQLHSKHVSVGRTPIAETLILDCYGREVPESAVNLATKFSRELFDWLGGFHPCCKGGRATADCWFANADAEAIVVTCSLCDKPIPESKD